jgi:hypothetical protein
MKSILLIGQVAIFVVNYWFMRGCPRAEKVNLNRIFYSDLCSPKIQRRDHLKISDYLIPHINFQCLSKNLKNLINKLRNRKINENRQTADKLIYFSVTNMLKYQRSRPKMPTLVKKLVARKIHQNVNFLQNRVN